MQQLDMYVDTDSKGVASARQLDIWEGHVRDLYANTNNSTFRSRVASAVGGGYDFSDTLHDIYLDFGYPDTITFRQFWNMYRRFGIARNVADLPVDTSWITIPEVIGDTRFNRVFEQLVTQVKFWVRMKGLDTRQRVGRYGGMFMRVRDNKKPDEPLEGDLNGIAALVQMIPLFEGQLDVLTTETDLISDSYGMPTMYQFNGGSEGNRNDQINAAFSIHPSRIVIAAEGADDGGIYGVSSLEAPYNSLMDLRKIIGAGGEGFYKNASQNIIFKLMDGASAKANEVILSKFSENYDEFAHNRFRRGMWTPGLEPSVLDSKLVEPKEFFMNALNDVAAAAKTPATILIGQQTGRLASGEDSKHYLSIINSRRNNYMTDIVRDVIVWCMTNGVLPVSEIEIKWSDLLALSDTEKLGNADKMADINTKQFNSGGGAPFTGEEVRDAAGFEGEPEEVDDDGEEEASI